jgi:hypothetical protein
MKRTIYALGVIGLITVAGGQARADVLLTGPDANAGSYSTSALAAVANGGDTVSSGGLTGITLWGLLGGADAAQNSPNYGAITTSTPNGANGKNAILRYYLLGTGAGGQRSVVSLGEIDPSFGGTAPVAPFVAFQNGGGLLATPQLVVPGAAGRGLVNLTSLQLLAVPAVAMGPGGASTAVQLKGNVAQPELYEDRSAERLYPGDVDDFGRHLHGGPAVDVPRCLRPDGYGPGRYHTGYRWL